MVPEGRAQAPEYTQLEGQYQVVGYNSTQGERSVVAGYDGARNFTPAPQGQADADSDSDGEMGGWYVK